MPRTATVYMHIVIVPRILLYEAYSACGRDCSSMCCCLPVHLTVYTAVEKMKLRLTDGVTCYCDVQLIQLIDL